MISNLVVAGAWDARIRSGERSLQQETRKSTDKRIYRSSSKDSVPHDGGSRFNFSTTSIDMKTASYIWFLQLYLRGANSPAEHHRTGGMTDRMERRTGTMKYDKEADGIWKMLVWAVGHGISC
jgi:hypothetical protein